MLFRVLGRMPVIIITIFISSRVLTACTAFCLSDSGRVLVGKNYDWYVESGLIIINKANVAKTALVDQEPAIWVSKYGSITFNQYGREMPNGGMNEAGLVVEVLWLEPTDYPRPDHRRALGELQWIQYQLDNCSTVDEVIASDSLVRIDNDSPARVHFFVADAGGECATVEFIDGKTVAHYGDDLPIRVITNNTYDELADYAEQYSEFGGKRQIGERDLSADIFSRASSLDRFLQAARKTHQFNSASPEEDIEYAFNTLELVRSGERTVWKIVYDLTNRTIYFQSRQNKGRKSFSFDAFNYDCDSPVKVIDINILAQGNVEGKFIRYTDDINYRYLQQAFRDTYFLQGTSGESIKALAMYPSSLKCSD